MPDYAAVCELAVRKAGAVLQQWIGRVEVRKKGPADLVTSADFAAQETIREVVLGMFPDHELLGEEGTGTGSPTTEGKSAYRWVADPLDGTTNYVHGVPHYSVSLALEHQGQIITGAVYDPNRDECFTATAGQGAYLNGRPIHTSQVTELSEGLAAVGFPYDLRRDSPDLLVFLEAAPVCQAIRRTGSASLNLCYVASGRFDLCWSYSTKVWDVAAGVLLIREAGGVVTSPTGGEFVLEQAHFLAAANEPLSRRLIDLALRAVV